MDPTLPVAEPSYDSGADKLPMEQPSDGSGVKRLDKMSLLKGVVLPILVVGGVAGGLAYYFSSPDGLGDFWPTLGDFRNEDPFNATRAEDAYTWRTSGPGLELRIVNALEPKWYDYFGVAVEEWENGSPDVLTLSTEIVNHESDCDPMTGGIKVCNGNFGDTKWHGLNIAIVQFDTITASCAKMNDFYLASASTFRRQYTMCHELGHGFGLPHTDEAFWNRDLGNCMDYTARPRRNMSPDRSNFEYLSVMYGVPSAPGEAQPSTPASANGGGVRPPPPPPPEKEKEKEKDKDKDDRRRTEVIPAQVLKRVREISKHLENGPALSDRPNGWRLLHQSEYAIAHEVDIGDGYRVRADLLLHQNE